MLAWWNTAYVHTWRRTRLRLGCAYFSSKSFALCRLIWKRAKSRRVAGRFRNRHHTDTTWVKGRGGDGAGSGEKATFATDLACSRSIWDLGRIKFPSCLWIGSSSNKILIKGRNNPKSNPKNLFQSNPLLSNPIFNHNPTFQKGFWSNPILNPIQIIVD